MHRTQVTLTVLAISALPACVASPAAPGAAGAGGAPAVRALQDTTTQAPGPGPADDTTLANRTIDYGQALRIAALKLVGDLPSNDEMAKVIDGASYAAQIDAYLADPRFPRQMQAYFQNTMKMGGQIQVAAANNMTVTLDTAPTFAAKLVVAGRPMSDLFTATTNTCPTLDPNAGTFKDQSCQNGGPTVGILTDPGVQAQFYSNMAFRRVRWIQETFVCAPFPTESSATPVAMGSGEYVSPWPFDSISGGPMAPINFKDTSAVICANCHATMNHIAPLFANFDAAGQVQGSIQVHTPTPMNPITQLSDWLPDGMQTFAWRYGTTVKDLAGLGQAMAADPVVARCHVARAWNWAMSKLDIVNDQELVPDTTIGPLVAAFTAGNQQLKPILKQIFTSDDFVKF